MTTVYEYEYDEQGRVKKMTIRYEPDPIPIVWPYYPYPYYPTYPTITYSITDGTNTTTTSGAQK